MAKKPTPKKKNTSKQKKPQSQASKKKTTHPQPSPLYGQHKTLPIELVDLDPNNPRKTFDADAITSLAKNILEEGQLQDISVRPNGDRWMVIFGQRRYLAVKEAGIPTIEAKILDVDEDKALILAIIENSQREGIDPVEEAISISKLNQHGKSITDISAHLGKSQHWVASRLKLAEMDDEIQGMVSRNEIGMRHIEALAKIDNEELRLSLARQSRHCTASEIERKVAALLRKVSCAPWPNGHKVKTKGETCGPCTSCIKRSDKQNDLFGPTGDALCTDSQCWDALMEAYRKSLVAKLKKEGKTILSDYDYQNAKRKIHPWCRTDSEITKAKKAGNEAKFYVTESCSIEQFYMVANKVVNASANSDTPDNPADPEDDEDQSSSGNPSTISMEKATKLGAAFLSENIDQLGWQKALILILISTTVDNFGSYDRDNICRLLEIESDNQAFQSKITPLDAMKRTITELATCSLLPQEFVRMALESIEGAPQWNDLIKQAQEAQ